VGNEEMTALKPYTSYRKTDLPWLGQIPVHWDVLRIKYSTYVKARVGWQGLTSDEFVEAGPILVTGTDFDRGKVNWGACYHVSEERYLQDPFIMLREGDLLITKDGTIGKIAVVRGLPDKATLNSGVFVTRPRKNLYLTEYLYWILLSNAFTDFIDLLKSGTTINHLYQNTFVNFAFPRPSMAEQQAIAAYLDRQTAKIDVLIAKKQRLLDLLAEQRAALISQAVTKGLNSSAKMKDSGVAWLGQVPNHWEVDLVKRHFDIDLGKMLDSSKQPENGFLKPYLRAANIYWEGVWLDDVNEMKFTKEQLKRYRLQKSDLLVTEGGATVGRSTIYQGELEEVYYQNSINRARPKGTLPVKYLYYWLFALKLTGFIDNVVSKATFGHLTKDKLELLQMAVPTKEEAEQIGKYLDTKLLNIARIEDKIKDVMERLREYRAALISSVVTGKVDVREII
jgi:type I restriction enzyme S subunit